MRMPQAAPLRRLIDLGIGSIVRLHTPQDVRTTHAPTHTHTHMHPHIHTHTRTSLMKGLRAGRMNR